MDLIAQLRRDEGLRLKPYRDSVGKLTIGIGRNLDDVGISEAEAEQLLQNDIDRTKTALYAAFPWVSQLDAVRQAVLFNMAFNMGVEALKNFTITLGHVQRAEFKEAAAAMMKSLWATQVPARAGRLATQMETGVWV